MVSEMIISKSRRISHKSKKAADKNTFQRNKWFDQECKVQKRIVSNTRKTYRQRMPESVKNTSKRKRFVTYGQEESQASDIQHYHNKLCSLGLSNLTPKISETYL